MYKTKLVITAISLLVLPSQNYMYAAKATPPLSHPLLKDIDGVQGLMDVHKIQKTLWLIKEVNQMQNGFYRVNAQGEPDPSHGSSVKECLFQGKKQTLKNLVELEANIETFTKEEKAEFNTLFQAMKAYFDKLNALFAHDARGMHQFIYQLVSEFCQKRNRTDSLLLNWDKGNEIELFRKSVTNFKIFLVFSTDLMKFLEDLVNSCPKAFEEWNAAYKKSHRN